MCAARPHRPVAGRPGPRGFTLLELSIVVVLLALLVALAWPALRRPMMRSVVQRAAGQLVKDLARARMAAIDSGRIMALQYELDGRRYVVTFADSLDLQDVATADRSAEDSASDTADDAAGDRPTVFEFEAEMDPDVVFCDPSAWDDAQLPPGSTLREMLEDEQQETEQVVPLVDVAAQNMADQTSSMSAPVFFYPTGRADNAELHLQGPDGYRLTVTLRGLTGAGSIGPLERAPRSTQPTDTAARNAERTAPREEFMDSDVPDNVPPQTGEL